MRVHDPFVWTWSEALELIERADKLQRQCFQLGGHHRTLPTWEPPVDIFETDRQFILLAALPGVGAANLIVKLEGAVLSVRGRRSMPEISDNAHIHRVEIPYGSFERRIELPCAQLRLGAPALRDGCLLLTLDKQAAP